MHTDIDISSAKELKAHIYLLEQRSRYLENEMQKRIRHFSSADSPFRRIRNAVKGISHSPLLKNNWINAAIGIGLGYFLKKKFSGQPNRLAGKIAGTALQLSAANLIGRNLVWIKRIPGKIFSRKSQQGE